MKNQLQLQATMGATRCNQLHAVSVSVAKNYIKFCSIQVVENVKLHQASLMSLECCKLAS
jgi:hypothetical protein